MQEKLEIDSCYFVMSADVLRILRVYLHFNFL